MAEVPPPSLQATGGGLGAGQSGKAVLKHTGLDSSLPHGSYITVFIGTNLMYRHTTVLD